MGTTKVKVIDLSSDEPEVKASRKAASKMRPSINTEEKPVVKVTKQRAPIATEDEAGVTPAEVKEAPEKKMGAKEKAKLAATEPAVAKIRPHGAKYKKVAEGLEKGKLYSAKEAFVLLSKTSYTKFDPTVEVHINVTQKNIRGNVNFPHAIGPKKEKKYLVFSDKLKTSDNKNVIIAPDSAIEDIISGKLKPGRDFNAVIAGPKFMPQMTKVAKVLGPAGMMPNPKNGTITDEPEKLIDGGASDAYEFRSDPTAPIVHIKLGKLSAKPDALEENLKALITAIGTAKIKKATLKSTMSPGIRIDVTTV
jgi:large subunit ribosomal protein L1